jgi:hypothetical protein
MLAIALVALGCKDSSFKSGGGAAPRPKTETINLVCGSNERAATPPTFSGIPGTLVKVTGELCSVKELSVSSEPISLVFVIDYSGSMSAADPERGGSCGRMRAASAIIDKMHRDLGAGQANIQVGLVHFHLTAETRAQLMPLRSFPAQINSANFCGFQDGRGTANTNYEAAFLQTKQMLQGTQGNKLVYFLTDGEPTAPVDPNAVVANPGQPFEAAYNAGMRAAEDLRASIPGLTMNAIFLDASGGLTTALPGFTNNGSRRDSRKYLEQIVGGRPDRVRIVTDADSLAAQITTFEVPAVTKLDSNGIYGELTSSLGGSRQVELESVVPAPGREGVWIFTTKPMELFGVSGQRTENRLILKSRTQKIPETTGIVYFEQLF